MKPAEVTPLRRPDPELQAIRALLQAQRRRTAWRLLASGLAMVGVAGAVLALSHPTTELPPSVQVPIPLTGVLTAAAGLTALIGVGLVGTALYALARTRSPGD